MGFITEADVIDARERKEYSMEQARAITHNLVFYEKAMDALGMKNPIFLGSKSGKFVPEYSDLVFLDWRGLNLQGADFGRHGSGKTSRATMMALQFNYFVAPNGDRGLPCVVFDRKGGEHLANHEALRPEFAKPLRNLNLMPFGTGANQVNVMPAFLEGETQYGRTKIQRFKMGYSDFMNSPDGDDLLDRALGIEETSTESEAKKYDAARRIKSEACALLEKLKEQKRREPTYELFYWAVRKLNEQLPESRKSISLESKVRRFLRRGFFGDDLKFDFLKEIKGGKIINFITSTRMARNPALQINEFWLHALLYEERKARRIKQVFVFSDEHDLISEAGATDNLLKQTYEMIAGKERWVSNLYLKSTQFPNKIPVNERKELDFCICTRLDENSVKYLEPVNSSERVLDKLTRLNYPTKGAKECALVTKEGIQTFYPAPPYCQFDVEQAEEEKKIRQEAMMWT